MWKLNSSDTKKLLSSENAQAKDYGGVNPVEALENIKKRRQEKKKKKNATLKTALVLQGGGMRGVFGAGVCCGLQEIGYTEGFDEVYGVSAGALNGAYFLSGQASYGTTIYYQEINNRNFINFFRIRKIMDIDFLMDTVTKKKPLQVRRLLTSSTSLNVLLTQVSTGETVMFKSKSGNNEDILNILKATTAMPFLYDIPVNIHGVDYLDGGISCPVPVAQAIEEKCTDILVVMTRPRNYRPSRRFFSRYFIEPGMKKYGENFYRTFINRHKIYAEQLSIIRGERLWGGRQVNILAIFPGESVGVKRTTKKETVLKDAAIEGAVKTLRLFDICFCYPAEVLKFLNY